MRKKKEKKPDLMTILRVALALHALRSRLAKLVLPVGFEDATRDLQTQLLITAGSLDKAADAVEAELIANNPDYAEMVRKRTR